MSDIPDPDPQAPPVEYVNTVDPADPRVEVAPDQTPTYEGEAD